MVVEQYHFFCTSLWVSSTTHGFTTKIRCFASLVGQTRFNQSRPTSTQRDKIALESILKNRAPARGSLKNIVIFVTTGTAKRSRWKLGPGPVPQERSKSFFRPGMVQPERSKWLLGPASVPSERSKSPLGHGLVPHGLEDCARSCTQILLFEEYVLGSATLCSATLCCTLLVHGNAQGHTT